MAAWLTPGEVRPCSICGNPTVVWCSTEVCPDCHKSEPIEDCVRATVRRLCIAWEIDTGGEDEE